MDKKAYTELTLTVIRLQERTALLASSDNGDPAPGPGPTQGNAPTTYYGTFG